MNLKENYARVREQIAEACLRAGRNPDEVHLIAVSKTHSPALIDELFDLGQVDFAENRIAELAEKKRLVKSPTLKWHLIGQLQTNKVKLLEPDTILHSLDRPSLAEALQKRFEGKRPIRCLLQVNCSGEESKSGVAPAELNLLADFVADKSAIEVIGLMTMAENTKDTMRIRATFALLRELSAKLAERQIFPRYEGWLSMGMSGDFREAIAEGATHIRLGSAIFGYRQATQF